MRLILLELPRLLSGFDSYSDHFSFSQINPYKYMYALCIMFYAYALCFIITIMHIVNLKHEQKTRIFKRKMKFMKDQFSNVARYNIDCSRLQNWTFIAAFFKHDAKNFG